MKAKEEAEIKQGFPWVFDNEIDSVKFYADDGSGVKQTSLADCAVKNGEAVEAEVVSGGDLEQASAGSAETEDAEEEEKKERTIYYVTDPAHQSQYVRMFRENGMQAFVLNSSIDQPFISQLEAKNEGIHFARVDAEIQDALLGEEEAEDEKKAKEDGEKLEKIVRKALDLAELI
mgnify:CR=1 FL=1